MNEMQDQPQIEGPEDEVVAAEPVTAAHAAATEPAVPPKETKRRLPLLVLLLFVVAAAAGIFWVSTTTPPPGEVTATEPGSSDQSVDVSAPLPVAGEEPIADAAEKILPSVVQIRTSDGVGSGVVFDDGLILTAAHVVAGEDTVLVRLEDGENLEGTVLGGTSETDIAVVQIDNTDVPHAQLALDYKPRVGQLAIAVGSPWDLQSTVTAGIVSAVDQPVGCNESGNCRSMLQTDAAINPGNSGGALVDREGKVIGINVSIFSLSGANDGVGFAVPISIAYDVAQRIVAGEPIETAFFGVVGDNATTGRAGAVVTEVLDDSAALEAGIEVGDLIVSIDGVTVQGIADLASQVRSHRPGDSVQIALVRDGQELTIRATLGIRSDDIG